MKAILSADLNWGIGYCGKLLMCVPEDMKFFRQMTTGKVVVMGRETFESFPGKQPLKDRVNIVLSKNPKYISSDLINSNLINSNLINSSLIICRSLDELLQELEKYPADDIFIIGGESVYTQLLPYCTEVYVTRFEKVFEADRHFSDLDRMDEWRLVSESAPSVYQDMSFRFLKYIRIAHSGQQTQ